MTGRANNLEVSAASPSSRGAAVMEPLRDGGGGGDQQIKSYSRRFSSSSSSTKSPQRQTGGGYKSFRGKPLLSASSIASSPPGMESFSNGSVGLEGWIKAKKETHNVWMCSLCGMAFRSLAEAEHHEVCCIREAFAPNDGEVLAAPPIVFPHDTSLQQQQQQQQAQAQAQAPLDWNVGGGGGETSPNSLMGNGVGCWKLSRSTATPAGTFRDFFFPTNHASSTATAAGNSTTTTTVTIGAPPTAATTSLALSSVHALALDDSVRQYMLLTDDALCKVVRRASSYVLTASERNAERHLALWTRDRVYYDTKSRKRRAAVNYKSTATGILAKLQTKFSEAYELIKEGEYHEDDHDGHHHRHDEQDHREKKGASTGGTSTTTGDAGNNAPKPQEIRHDESTLYVNVVVKHSAKMVRNELERLAQQIWSDPASVNQFERFRSMARANIVKLAGLALATDFTPRRVAGQLSNDLHRLLVPELKLRGVDIETEVEYRMGPFFVLSVNILRINWVVLMRRTHHDFMRRQRRWMRQKEEQEQSSSKSGSKQSLLSRLLLFPSTFDVLAQCLAWLYHVHWVLAVPLCTLLYTLFLGRAVRRFILTSVTDDIFHYVEKKGMEMDLGVEEAPHQAAFMLAALRELRQDERTLLKKKAAAAAAASAAAEDSSHLLGPYLGPAVPQDAQPPSIPEGFQVPESLEFVNLEMDLPVGFRRLRWAFLHKDSEFFQRVIFETEAHYENITIGEWTMHNDSIGLPETPEGLSNQDFVGAQKESSYLMPKSAFVKANMAYEQVTLTVYNDYCFVLKKKTRTPDVPYGSTFLAWTQYVVTCQGPNQCRMVCSVEAEFPNGPPLVGRQIKSGMRAGTAELFLLIGETIGKYANAFPPAKTAK